MTLHLKPGQLTFATFTHNALADKQELTEPEAFLNAIAAILPRYEIYCRAFAKYSTTDYYLKHEGNPEWVEAHEAELAKRKAYLDMCMETYLAA